MMCIISKKRIAICEQVGGMRGEVFAASPMALQSWCKCMPNEPSPTYGHSWPSMPECLFEIVDWQSKKKLGNCDGRAICNASNGIDAGHGVSRHWDVSDGSDGPHPLWGSHFAWTELFFADVVIVRQRCMIQEISCVYWNLKNHCCENTASSLNSPSALHWSLSATLKVSIWPAQRSQLIPNFTILQGKYHSILNAPP